MRVMLNQPMTGKTDEEIVNTREKAVAYGLDIIYEE